MADGLNPGDKVVALGAAATAAAVVSGMVTGGAAWWIARHNVPLSLAGVIGGAFFGLIVGRIVGRIFFSAAGSGVVVVKWGPGSLPGTLKGNVAAGLISSFALSSLIAITTKTDIKAFYIPCVAVSAVLSAILALLASLL